MKRVLQRVLGGKSQSKQTSRRNSRSASLRVEGLETRTMMSLTGVAIRIPLPVVPINLAVDTFSDGDFTSPVQTKGAPNNYTSNPIGSPWLFAGQSGVSGNGSNFTAGNPDVPAGTQVAFLQKNGIMLQSFDLSQGTYSISFQAAQRQNAQSKFQAFEVWVDNTLVDLVVPATTAYTSYHSINFTVTGTGLHILEFKGVDPLAGNDTAFITNVQINGAAATADPNEPTVLAQAVTDFQRDGSLTYSDMLGLFNTVVAEVPPVITYRGGGGKGPTVYSQGGLTTPQLQWLQTIVDDAACFNMPADVSNLASKVLNGDPGNATYQYLGTGGAEITIPLGNLFAGNTANNYLGSSATQLQDLVNKWFLGENDPATSNRYALASGTLFASVTLSGSGTLLGSGSLFASGTVFSSGPSYKDIYQGGADDCWLLASLGVTVAHDPSIIQSMFTDDGTALENGVQVHVWTVRFFDNGVASYLTVNNYLPANDGYLEFANDDSQPINDSSNVLWVALAEKAYAQLCESGWNARPQSNAYSSLNFGYASTALPVITGEKESSSDPFGSESSFTSAIASGSLLTLATPVNNFPGGINPLGIVGNHDYVVLGYDASNQTFTLLNRWGWNYSGAPGILNLTWVQLKQNFYLDGNSNAPGSSALAGPSASASEASLPQTGPELSPSVGLPAPSSGATTSNLSAANEGKAATALRDAAISDLILPAQSGAASLDVDSPPVRLPRSLQRTGQFGPGARSGNAS
jgi:hypothetical protein